MHDLIGNNSAHYNGVTNLESLFPGAGTLRKFHSQPICQTLPPPLGHGPISKRKTRRRQGRPIMANDQRFSSKVLIGLLITALATLLAGCMMQKAPPMAGTYEGPPVKVGQGVARSFVTIAADGMPATIGIRLSEGALSGLPVEPPAGSDGYEYALELPPEAAGTGYKQIGLDWNPKGHIPVGVYDKPHFDFHFYMIAPDVRSKITAVGDDLARAHLAPPAEFMPTGYILPPGTEVPDMGAHAIDPNADEFTKKSFTKTFIYGFYDGKMIFIEPMITKAYLETKPTVHVSVAVPKKYSRPGWYPTQYGIRYDDVHREYEITLENLMAAKQ